MWCLPTVGVISPNLLRTDTSFLKHMSQSPGKQAHLIPKIVGLQTGNFSHIRDRSRMLEVSPSKRVTSDKLDAVSVGLRGVYLSRRDVKQQVLLGVGTPFQGIQAKSGMIVNPFASAGRSHDKQIKSYRREASVGESLQQVIWSHRADRSDSSPVDYIRVLGMEDSIQVDQLGTPKLNSSSGTGFNSSNHRSIEARLQVSGSFDQKAAPKKKRISRY